jgi:hypothetical protein
MSEKVTIRCSGCDKTQTLRPRKVEKCDGYYCGRCDFKPPAPPEGYVVYTIVQAAGGFWGYRMQIADLETQVALRRARILRARAVEGVLWCPGDQPREAILDGPSP